MRKMYKGSHSVSYGGQHFIQRIESGNAVFVGDLAERLKSDLMEVSKTLKAEDATIKICKNHFHVFFHMPARYAPAVFIDLFRFTVENVMKEFGMDEQLDEDYVFTGIYDLSEEHIKKEMKILGEEL